MKYQKHLEPRLSLVFKKKTTSEKVILTKLRIISFIKFHNRRPSKHAPEKTEKSLACKLRNYINPATFSFDPIFADEIEKVDHYVQAKALQLAERHLKEIEIFITKNGVRPTARKSIKNPSTEEEKLIYNKLSHLRYDNLPLTESQQRRLKKIILTPTKNDVKRYTKLLLNEV